jgi:hypothetical protein
MRRALHPRCTDAPVRLVTCVQCSSLCGFHSHLEGTHHETQNVGNALTASVRIVAGLVLIGLAATGTVGWWGWLGAVPLATVP